MRLKIILIATISFVILGRTVLAFEICVPASVKVKGLQGLVVFTRDGKEEALPQVKVTVEDCREDCVLVAEVMTDNGGRFRFPDIKPGKYVVKASIPTTGGSETARVKVGKMSGSKVEQELVFKMTMKPFTCSAGEVEVRKRIIK